MTYEDSTDHELPTDDGDTAEPDPYHVLGLEPGATGTEVARAYRQRVREHPPERDPEGFKRIREAYETLRSPRKRAEMTLLELRPGPAEFDLDRLRDLPPPPLPERYVEHLLDVVLAELDDAIDARVAEAQKDAILGPSVQPRGGAP